MTSRFDDIKPDQIDVIAGELGSFLKCLQGYDFFELVNVQLKELEDCLPGYACVNSEGLQDNGDFLHFNAASLREFGIRYARRFLDMTRPDTLS